MEWIPIPKAIKTQTKKGQKSGKATRDETSQNVSILTDPQRSLTTDTTTVVKPVKADRSAEISGIDAKALVTPRTMMNKGFTAEEKRQAALQQWEGRRSAAEQKAIDKKEQPIKEEGKEK